MNINVFNIFKRNFKKKNSIVTNFKNKFKKLNVFKLKNFENKKKFKYTLEVLKSINSTKLFFLITV